MNGLRGPVLWVESVLSGVGRGQEVCEFMHPRMETLSKMVPH